MDVGASTRPESGGSASKGRSPLSTSLICFSSAKASTAFSGRCGRTSAALNLVKKAEESTAGAAQERVLQVGHNHVDARRNVVVQLLEARQTLGRARRAIVLLPAELQRSAIPSQVWLGRGPSVLKRRRRAAAVAVRGCFLAWNLACC